MTNNQQLMRKAKEAIAPMWIEACIATLIFVLLMSVSGFTYVGEYIVYGPLTLGYVLFLIGLTVYKKNDYGTLFQGFNNFAQTLVAGLLYLLAVSIGSVLLIVPGIILACGFGMTFFLMADDPNLSGTDALQQSWNMMKGHKWAFFCLNCRFIGWWLLAALTCGILSLWVMPYSIVAQMNFYRQLRYGTY